MRMSDRQQRRQTHPSIHQHHPSTRRAREQEGRPSPHAVESSSSKWRHRSLHGGSTRQRHHPYRGRSSIRKPRHTSPLRQNRRSYDQAPGVTEDKKDDNNLSPYSLAAQFSKLKESINSIASDGKRTKITARKSTSGHGYGAMDEKRDLPFGRPQPKKKEVLNVDDEVSFNLPSRETLRVRKIRPTSWHEQGVASTSSGEQRKVSCLPKGAASEESAQRTSMSSNIESLRRHVPGERFIRDRAARVTSSKHENIETRTDKYFDKRHRQQTKEGASLYKSHTAGERCNSNRDDSVHRGRSSRKLDHSLPDRPSLGHDSRSSVKEPITGHMEPSKEKYQFVTLGSEIVNTGKVSRDRNSRVYPKRTSSSIDFLPAASTTRKGWKIISLNDGGKAKETLKTQSGSSKLQIVGERKTREKSEDSPKIVDDGSDPDSVLQPKSRETSSTSEEKNIFDVFEMSSCETPSSLPDKKIVMIPKSDSPVRCAFRSKQVLPDQSEKPGKDTAPVDSSDGENIFDKMAKVHLPSSGSLQRNSRKSSRVKQGNAALSKKETICNVVPEIPPDDADKIERIPDPTQPKTEDIGSSRESSDGENIFDTMAKLSMGTSHGTSSDTLTHSQDKGHGSSKTLVPNQGLKRCTENEESPLETKQCKDRDNPVTFDDKQRSSCHSPVRIRDHSPSDGENIFDKMAKVHLVSTDTSGESRSLEELEANHTTKESQASTSLLLSAAESTGELTKEKTCVTRVHVCQKEELKASATPVELAGMESTYGKEYGVAKDKPASTPNKKSTSHDEVVYTSLRRTTRSEKKRKSDHSGDEVLSPVTKSPAEHRRNAGAEMAKCSDRTGEDDTKTGVNDLHKYAGRRRKHGMFADRKTTDDRENHSDSAVGGSKAAKSSKDSNDGSYGRRTTRSSSSMGEQSSSNEGKSTADEVVGRHAGVGDVFEISENDSSGIGSDILGEAIAEFFENTATDMSLAFSPSSSGSQDMEITDVVNGLLQEDLKVADREKPVVTQAMHETEGKDENKTVHIGKRRIEDKGALIISNEEDDAMAIIKNKDTCNRLASGVTQTTGRESQGACLITTKEDATNKAAETTPDTCNQTTIESITDERELTNEKHLASGRKHHKDLKEGREKLELFGHESQERGSEVNVPSEKVPDGATDGSIEKIATLSSDGATNLLANSVAGKNAQDANADEKRLGSGLTETLDSPSTETKDVQIDSSRNIFSILEEKNKADMRILSREGRVTETELEKPAVISNEETKNGSGTIAVLGAERSEETRNIFTIFSKGEKTNAEDRCLCGEIANIPGHTDLPADSILNLAGEDVPVKDIPLSAENPNKTSKHDSHATESTWAQPESCSLGTSSDIFSLISETGQKDANEICDKQKEAVVNESNVGGIAAQVDEKVDDKDFTEVEDETNANDQSKIPAGRESEMPEDPRSDSGTTEVGECRTLSLADPATTEINVVDEPLNSTEAEAVVSQNQAPTETEVQSAVEDDGSNPNETASTVGGEIRGHHSIVAAGENVEEGNKAKETGDELISENKFEKKEVEGEVKNKAKQTEDEKKVRKCCEDLTVTDVGMNDQIANRCLSGTTVETDEGVGSSDLAPPRSEMNVKVQSKTPLSATVRGESQDISISQVFDAGIQEVVDLGLTVNRIDLTACKKNTSEYIESMPEDNRSATTDLPETGTGTETGVIETNEDDKKPNESGNSQDTCSSNFSRMAYMSLHLKKLDVTSTRMIPLDTPADISESTKCPVDVHSSSLEDKALTSGSAEPLHIHAPPIGDRSDLPVSDALGDVVDKTAEESGSKQQPSGLDSGQRTVLDQNESSVFKIPLDSSLIGSQSEEEPPLLDRFDDTSVRRDYNSSSSGECSMPVIVCVKSVLTEKNDSETMETPENTSDPRQGLQEGSPSSIIGSEGRANTISGGTSSYHPRLTEEHSALSTLETTLQPGNQSQSTLHLPVKDASERMQEVEGGPTGSAECSAEQAPECSKDPVPLSEASKDMPPKDDELGINKDVDVIDGFSFVSFASKEDLVAFTSSTNKRGKSGKSKKKTSAVTGISWAISRKKKPQKKTPPKPKKLNIFPTAVKEQSEKLIEKYEEQFRRDLMTQSRHEILHPALLKRGVSIKRSLDCGIPLLIDLKLLDVNLDGKGKHPKKGKKLSKKGPSRFTPSPVEMLLDSPSPSVGGYPSDADEDIGDVSINDTGALAEVPAGEPLTEQEKSHGNLQSQPNIPLQLPNVVECDSDSKNESPPNSQVKTSADQKMPEAAEKAPEDQMMSKDQEIKEAPRDMGNLQEILAKENAIFKPFEKPVLNQTSAFLSSELDTYLQEVSAKKAKSAAVIEDKKRKAAPSRHKDKLNSAIQEISFLSLVRGKSKGTAPSKKCGHDSIEGGPRNPVPIAPNKSIVKTSRKESTLLLERSTSGLSYLKHGEKSSVSSRPINTTPPVARQSKTSRFLDRLVSNVKKATDHELSQNGRDVPAEWQNKKTSEDSELSAEQKGYKPFQIVKNRIVHTGKQTKTRVSSDGSLPVRDPTSPNFITEESPNLSSSKMTRKRRKQLMTERETPPEYAMPRDYSDIPGSPSLCGNDFCRLGCICDSLEGATTEAETPQHCRKMECMFECACERFPSLRILRARKRPAIFREGGMVFYDGAGLLSDTKDNKKRMLNPSEKPEPSRDKKPEPVKVHVKTSTSATKEKPVNRGVAVRVKEPTKSTAKPVRKDLGFARGRIYVAKHIRYASKMEELRSSKKREADAMDDSKATASLPPLKFVRTSDGYALQSSPKADGKLEDEDDNGFRLLKRVDKMLVQSHRYRMEKSKKAKEEALISVRKNNDDSNTNAEEVEKSLASGNDGGSNTDDDSPSGAGSTLSEEPPPNKGKEAHVVKEATALSRPEKEPKKTLLQITPKSSKPLSFNISSSNTSVIPWNQANQRLQEHFANGMVLKNISGVNTSSPAPSVKSVASSAPPLTYRVVSNGGHLVLSSVESTKGVAPTSSTVTYTSSPVVHSMPVTKSTVSAPAASTKSSLSGTSKNKVVVPLPQRQPPTSAGVYGIPISPSPSQLSGTDKNTIFVVQNFPGVPAQKPNSTTVPPPLKALGSVPIQQVPLLLLTGGGSQQKLVLGQRLPQTPATLLQQTSGQSTHALSGVKGALLSPVAQSNAGQSVANQAVTVPQFPVIAPKNPVATGKNVTPAKSVPAYWFKDKNGKPVLLVPISSAKTDTAPASQEAPISHVKASEAKPPAASTKIVKPKFVTPLCQLAGNAVALHRKLTQPYRKHKRGCTFIPSFHPQNPNRSFHLLIDVITNTQCDWQKKPLAQMISNMAATMKPQGVVRFKDFIIQRLRFKKHVQIAKCINVSSSVAKNCTKKLRIIGLFESTFLIVSSSSIPKGGEMLSLKAPEEMSQSDPDTARRERRELERLAKGKKQEHIPTFIDLTDGQGSTALIDLTDDDGTTKEEASKGKVCGSGNEVRIAEKDAPEGGDPNPSGKFDNFKVPESTSVPKAKARETSRSRLGVSVDRNAEKPSKAATRQEDDLSQDEPSTHSLKNTETTENIPQMASTTDTTTAGGDGNTAEDEAGETEKNLREREEIVEASTGVDGPVCKSDGKESPPTVAMTPSLGGNDGHAVSEGSSKTILDEDRVEKTKTESSSREPDNAISRPDSDGSNESQEICACMGTSVELDKLVENGTKCVDSKQSPEKEECSNLPSDALRKNVPCPNRDGDGSNDSELLEKKRKGLVSKRHLEGEKTSAALRGNEGGLDGESGGSDVSEEFIGCLGTSKQFEELLRSEGFSIESDGHIKTKDEVDNLTNQENELKSMSPHRSQGSPTQNCGGEPEDTAGMTGETVSGGAECGERSITDAECSKNLSTGHEVSCEKAIMGSTCNVLVADTTDSEEQQKVSRDKHDQLETPDSKSSSIHGSTCDILSSETRQTPESLSEGGSTTAAEKKSMNDGHVELSICDNLKEGSGDGVNGDGVNPTAAEPLSERESAPGQEQVHGGVSEGVTDCVNDADENSQDEKHLVSSSRNENAGQKNSESNTAFACPVTKDTDGEDAPSPKKAVDGGAVSHLETGTTTGSIDENEQKGGAASAKSLEDDCKGADIPKTGISKIYGSDVCHAHDRAKVVGGAISPIRHDENKVKEPAQDSSENNAMGVNTLPENALDKKCASDLQPDKVKTHENVSTSKTLAGQSIEECATRENGEETSSEQQDPSPGKAFDNEEDQSDTVGGPVITGDTKESCASEPDASRNLHKLVSNLSCRVTEGAEKGSGTNENTSIAEGIGKVDVDGDEVSSTASSSDNESDVESSSEDEEEVIPERTPWFEGASSCTLRLSTLVGVIFDGKKPFEASWPTGFLDKTGWAEGTPRLRRFECSFLGETFSGGGISWPLKPNKKEIKFMSPPSMTSLLERGELQWQKDYERAQKLAEAIKPSFRELPPSQRLPKRDKVKCLEYCIADKKLDEGPALEDEDIDIIAFDEEDEDDYFSDDGTIYTTSSYEDEQREKNDSLFKLAEMVTYISTASQSREGTETSNQNETKSMGLSREESNKKCLDYVSKLKNVLGQQGIENREPESEATTQPNPFLLSQKDVVMAMSRDSYGISSESVSAPGSLTSSPTAGSRRRKADMRETRPCDDADEVSWEVKVLSDEDDDNSSSNIGGARGSTHLMKERERRACQRRQFLKLSRLVFKMQPELQAKVTILAKGAEVIDDLKETSKRLREQLKVERCHNFKQRKRLKEILTKQPHLMSVLRKSTPALALEGTTVPLTADTPGGRAATAAGMDIDVHKLIPEIGIAGLEDTARAAKELISAMESFMSRPAPDGRSDVRTWTIAGLLDAGNEDLPSYLQNREHLDRPQLQLKDDPLTPSQRGQLEKAQRWRRRKQTILDSLPPLEEVGGDDQGGEDSSQNSKSDSAGSGESGWEEDVDVEGEQDPSDEEVDAVSQPTSLSADPPVDSGVKKKVLASLRQKILAGSSDHYEPKLFLSQPGGRSVPIFPEKRKKKVKGNDVEPSGKASKSLSLSVDTHVDPDVAKRVDRLKRKMGEFLVDSGDDSDGMLFYSQPDGRMIPILPQRVTKKKVKKSKRKKKKRASFELVEEYGSAAEELSIESGEEEYKKLKKKKKKKRKRKLDEKEHSTRSRSRQCLEEENLQKKKKRKRASEESESLQHESHMSTQNPSSTVSPKVDTTIGESSIKLAYALELEEPEQSPCEEADSDWREGEQRFESTVTVDADGNFSSTTKEQMYDTETGKTLEPSSEQPFGDLSLESEEEGEGWIDDETLHSDSLLESGNGKSDQKGGSDDVFVGKKAGDTRLSDVKDQVDAVQASGPEVKRVGAKADKTGLRNIPAVDRTETQEVRAGSSTDDAKGQLPEQAAGTSAETAEVPKKETSVLKGKAPETTEDINVDIKKIIPCLQVEEKDDGTLDVVLQGEYSDERLDELFALPGVMDYLRKAAAKKAAKSQTPGPPR